MLQGLYAMSMNCMEAAEAQFHTAISVSQLFIGLDGNLNQDMKTHVNIALSLSWPLLSACRISEYCRVYQWTAKALISPCHAE